MSETIEPIEVLAAPIQVPPVRRASPADINELGAWLIPRMVEHWATTPQLAIAYLRASLPSNEQALVVCGDAIGMCHVEPGRMGHPCRITVDFVLSSRPSEAIAGEAGVEECCEIYAWMVNYGKGHGASGLFRVDDFCDVDRSFIRARIGKLTKRESFNAVF